MNYNLGSSFSTASNFFKVAFRNFTKKWLFTSINFVGLTVGITSVALSLLFINYETSFDSFHDKAENLYRLGMEYRSQKYSLVNFKDYNQTSPNDQLLQIQEYQNANGVEDACQFHINDSELFVETSDKRIPLDKILVTNTSQSFFDMFSWEFEEGGPVTNFREAILTHSTAIKLYGNNYDQVDDLLSNTITVNDTTYRLAGVIKDIPENSHFEFNMLLSKQKINYWGAQTYVELKPDATTNSVQSELTAATKIVDPSQAEDPLFAGNFLQPIESIHLNSNLLYELKTPGDIRYLYIFSLIGLIILVITIANYTNLSIALNSGRNREIGMRKVLGATKKGIARQFLMESVVLTLCTLPFVLISLEWLIPAFNDFMLTSLNNLFLSDPTYFSALLIGSILVGIISGIYPAIFLSKKGIKQLFVQDGLKSNTGKVPVRKVLITCQFTLLIGLISLTIFINQQMDFIQNKSLGYHKEGILFVELPDEGSYNPFKKQLLSNSFIEAIGTGSYLGTNPYNQLTYKLEGEQEVFDDAFSLWMDYDALKAYGINATFDKSKSDANEMFLINATASEALTNRYNVDKASLLNSRLITEPEYTQEDGTQGFPRKIDGFFADLNVFSLKEKVKPYFLRVIRNPEWTPRAIIKFNTAKTSDVLAAVKSAYSSLNSSSPIEYYFQNENLKALYEKEQRISQLTVYLSIIAVFLSISGLIALSAYLTSLRKKDMSVIKVLGATEFQIISRFNKEYIFLIALALLFSAPIAYFGVYRWLDSFAYKININPLVFMISAFLTLFITLVSVSFITYRTASSNLINSLRDN